MRATERIRLATRRALARRYGYAALRQLRRLARAAIADNSRAIYHPAGKPQPRDDLARAYSDALKRLRKKFGRLDFTDPRSQP